MSTTLWERNRALQNADMKTITIQEIPDHVWEELASQAAQAGLSMQQHLLAELTQLAACSSMSELVTRIRRRKEVTGSVLTAETVAEYRTPPGG